jgi:hypothetical protein
MSRTEIIKINDDIKALHGRVDKLDEKLETLAQLLQAANTKSTKSGVKVPPTARPETLESLEIGRDPQGA